MNNQSALRATAIKIGYLKSMRHMHHYMTSGEDTDNAGRRWGRLVHMAVLEPDKQPSIWPGKTRKDKGFKEWLGEQPTGNEITLEAEWSEVQICAQSVLSNSKAIELLAGTEREKAVECVTRYGRCVGRFDAWKPGTLVDLKTTGQVDARSFGSMCARMAYHLQFGWYDFLLGNQGYLAECYAVAVEADPPYDVAVYQIDPFDVGAGKVEACKIAEQYRLCESTGIWPGVQKEVETISLPEWAYHEPSAPLESGEIGDL